MTLEEQTAYLKSHTPRILAGMKVKQVEGKFDTGGHSESINVAYEIIPNGKGVEVLAARFENDGKVYPTDPVYLRPLEEAEPRLFFATWEHGWDGEFKNLGGPPDTPPSIHPYVQLADGAALIVVFHYPDDLFNDDAAAAIRPKQENLFTWISFIARNSKGDLTHLFDFECA
jgi:hypothetical protein